MTGNIILFRHAKAEAQNTGTDDHTRALTEEGVEHLKNSVDFLRSVIRPNQEIHIWTSPSLRAVQTAEIISEGLGITDILQFEFIRNGDFSDLENELSILSPSKTVIIVGHEPHLRDWSEKICGYQVPFKKSAGACFPIHSQRPLSGPLNYMIQWKAPQLDREKPIKSECRRLLVFYLSEVAKMQTRFLQRPEDIETAHQYRVKIRQVRSLISFIKPLLNSEDYERIQDLLRDMAGRFAYLREIDVLMEEWSILAESHPDLPKIPTVFLSVLKKERIANQADICAQLVLEPTVESLGSIWAWIFGDAWDKDLLDKDTATNKTYKDFVNERFDKWLRKAQKQFKRTDFNDIKAIHRLRIRFKKLRYVWTILEPLSIMENKDFLSDLKIIQDKLGKICDANRDVTLLYGLRIKYPKAAFQYESGVIAGYLLSRASQIRQEIEYD